MFKTCFNRESYLPGKAVAHFLLVFVRVKSLLIYIHESYLLILVLSHVIIVGVACDPMSPVSCVVTLQHLLIT
jgi:hypothetical protein